MRRHLSSFSLYISLMYRISTSGLFYLMILNQCHMCTIFTKFERCDLNLWPFDLERLQYIGCHVIELYQISAKLDNLRPSYSDLKIEHLGRPPSWFQQSLRDLREPIWNQHTKFQQYPMYAWLSDCIFGGQICVPSSVEWTEQSENRMWGGQRTITRRSFISLF